MRRFLLVTLLLFLSINSSFAKPVDELYGGVSEGQLIYYSFCSDKWYYQRPSQRKKCIFEVTRHVSEGSDSYSDYVSSNGQIITPAGSNYEFLYKGRLITYHIYDMKFYEIIYNNRNKQFIEIPLNDTDIRRILGNPKIIYISEFNKSNEVTVRKLPLLKKSFLLLNDTDKYFYRYSLSTPNKNNIVRTLFWAKAKETIDFSYYRDEIDEFPPYKIKVKNGIK